MAKMEVGLKMKNKKSIFFMCIVAIIFSFVIFHLYEKMTRYSKINTLFDEHKERYINLVINDEEILLFLEKLYYNYDELLVNCSNDQIIVSEPTKIEFTKTEFEHLKKLFDEIPIDTIKIHKLENDEIKNLELIYTGIVSKQFFYKDYGSSTLVYSPINKLIGYDELLSGWYYKPRIYE